MTSSRHRHAGSPPSAEKWIYARHWTSIRTESKSFCDAGRLSSRSSSCISASISGAVVDAFSSAPAPSLFHWSSPESRSAYYERKRTHIQAHGQPSERSSSIGLVLLSTTSSRRSRSSPTHFPSFPMSQVAQMPASPCSMVELPLPPDPCPRSRWPWCVHCERPSCVGEGSWHQ